MMIVPAVYIYSGGSEGAMSAGPGLIFITLPKVFASLPGGWVIGTAFFVLVFFAALTSSISLLEAVVSNVMDLTGWERRNTTLAVTGAAIAIGIPVSLGNGIWSNLKIIGMSLLDFMDFISNSVLMPLLALGTAVFIGFVLKPDKIVNEVEQYGVRFHVKRFFTVIIKWVAPVGIVAILLTYVASSLGILEL